MMKGVEILNKVAITEMPVWVEKSLTFGIVTILVTIIGMLIISYMTEWYIGDNICMIGVICLLAFTVGIVVVGDRNQVQTGKYRYEVILSEDVSITDIYEKYEVVEQRGEIWVLEDK